MDHYAVIGNPIQHSLSPLIHSLFAEQTKQVIHYSRMHVEQESLPNALLEFQNQGGKGVNITMPFKRKAFFLVDSVSDRAKRGGVINTIRFNHDGSRFGDNTDGVGIVRDIVKNHHFSIQGKRILLLGAGGAIRGIVEAILNHKPSHVMIANRTDSQAVMLAKMFSDLGPVDACPLSLLEKESFDLVVNGTSASLQNEMLNLPDGILKKGSFCYDMVYGVGMTQFLRWAKTQGAAFYVDGFGMLVEQAAESFYLWRGVRPQCEYISIFSLFLLVYLHAFQLE